MWKRKKWVPLAVLAFLLQLLLEAYAALHIQKLNLLPERYLYLAYGVLAGFAVLTFFLLFWGTGHGPGKRRRVRRIIAIILAICMGAGSVYVADVTGKISQTVTTVTETTTTLAAMEGVYVLSSDSAADIQAAADYSFGIMSDFDAENTQAAVSEISEVLGKQITTVSRPSAIENAAALYQGDIKAIILNEAYVSALTDTEDYADFETAAKLIYEVPVKKTIQKQTTEEATEVAGVSSDSAASAVGDGSSGKSLGGIVSDVTEQPFVVYISGSDTRSAILDTSRSDVNILMVVNPKTRQILLLNTPRDYYVENPAGNWAYDKLTHCGIYGIDCSEKALEKLYSVKINYYAQINFTGFETLIDAIGGVTVDSPEAFEAGGYSFTEGENTLDGKQALAFARERHAFAGGDNVRGQNQMRVIKSVISKITSDGGAVLLHYGEILDSLSGMFVTDMNSDDISALVKMQLNDMSSWNVESYAVTGTGGMDTTYSMPGYSVYVMYQNPDMVAKATGLIDKVENGVILTDGDVAG